ncbi:hypothetical protein C8Q77DRAFT_1051392 [Trametes polyzona]|nr:hypothetical protein C8Q77DRAFT_1051392 [Trametes polyzona]
MSADGWRVSISQEWDVLGPFPIHAREQHFLSPSFPIDPTRAIDFNATYPSSYADGGHVGWTKASARDDGLLEVSFPSVRWESLRATEGWAALQHHNVLRSALTVHPPSKPSALTRDTPRILVNLSQGSFFTIVPERTGKSQDDPTVPEWHAGNIYAMGQSPPNIVSLPIPPSVTEPTEYAIFVSGDYEIRLFGDPRHGSTEVPKLSITLTVEVEKETRSVARDASQDVYPDFVEGWAFGEALGVGLKSVDAWWTVENATAPANLAEVIDLLEKIRLAPRQHRIVPLRLTQTRPLDVVQLDFQLEVSSDSGLIDAIEVSIPVKNREHWCKGGDQASGITASYFFASSNPTAFLVKPPEKPNDGPAYPPVLATHGAGVDIFESDFWIKALPRQQRSWVIAPTGRTAWGLDWHGPSARDAWATVSALSRILNLRSEWQGWAFAPDTRVLLMGHSNGGQGAWYLAARYPDRVVGAVPAAGYLKSQSYVSWVQSAHYVDPALRAVLDSSLTPDDNDLFLSNLVDTPILAIHGGDDDNVPVWHTREAVAVLNTWNPDANVTYDTFRYREDPGEPHWYPSIFANDEVRSFVSSTIENSVKESPSISRSFTLTVAIPSDSGSLHGWSIHQVEVPGRLGRLQVELEKDAIRVRTTNVKAFSIHIGTLPDHVRDAPFVLDGQKIELDDGTWDASEFKLALSRENGIWTPYSLDEINAPSPHGRIASVLNTDGPLTLVIPKRQQSPELSAALRIAHNLNVYHKLNAEIIDAEEALQRLDTSSLGPGNVVVLDQGSPNTFAKRILAQGRMPFRLRDDTLQLRGRPLNEPNSATLFLHPHPTRAASSVLFVYGSDHAGLERALRLFPIRTGVTVPDWIVVGPQADERGSGGVSGAGVWGNDWSWNEAMSAF